MPVFLDMQLLSAHRFTEALYDLLQSKLPKSLISEILLEYVYCFGWKSLKMTCNTPGRRKETIDIQAGESVEDAADKLVKLIKKN